MKTEKNGFALTFSRLLDIIDAPATVCSHLQATVCDILESKNSHTLCCANVLVLIEIFKGKIKYHSFSPFPGTD